MIFGIPPKPNMISDTLVVYDLTNQQFVNCAYLEILRPSPPSLPVCLCRDKPSCQCILGSLLKEEPCPVPRKLLSPVGYLVEWCLKILNSLSRKYAFAVR